jgi:undecaprenyl-diphosphatase
VDTSWFRDVNSFEAHTGWLHGVLRLDATDGIALFALLLVLGWLLARRAADALTRVAAVAWTAIGCVIALALGQPISHLVARPRPFVALAHVHTLIHHSADFGFPSDHATAAGAVAAGLWWVDRRLGLVATVLALLLAFARVYVGVHYPGDVAGGLALGAVVTVVGALAAVPLLRRAAGWLARSRLRPLVSARPAAS